MTNLFRHGWEGCELDPRTYDPSYDAVYCKAAPSIFFGTSVAQFFAKEQVDTVFVTGCTTSGCVRASMIDAFSFGFRVMVPEPCSGDQEEEAHRANLLDVGRRYADVLTLEECLFYFESLASKTSVKRRSPAWVEINPRTSNRRGRKIQSLCLNYIACLSGALPDKSLVLNVYFYPLRRLWSKARS